MFKLIKIFLIGSFIIIGMIVFMILGYIFDLF